ncbi:MAG: hypothetical protein ACPL4K_02505 [Candidatus Margulisiibacteriota bacterium]
MKITPKAAKNLQAYRFSTLTAVASLLQEWCNQNRKRLSSVTISEVQKNLRQISYYPNLEKLRFVPESGEIITITKESVSNQNLRSAIDAFAKGEILTEDTAAGEATRLGMGSKWGLTPIDLAQTYINLSYEAKKLSGSPNALKDFRNKNNLSEEQVKELLSINEEDLAKLREKALQLLPISLGVRHKLQYVYDLISLASRQGLNTEDVLKSQWVLTILNEENFIPIIRETVKFNYFGLDSSRALFMIQPSHPGIEITTEGLNFSPHAPWRLWNHGDIPILSTMDNQIFTTRFNLYGEIERKYLKADQFEEILASVSVKVSYPIEDLGYLTQALDINKIALAFALGKQGYRMIMEVTQQKDPPQKGGFWAYDEKLKRGVIIESDWGGDLVNDSSLAKIKYLNRNFNIFPNPVEVWRKVREEGLPVHLAVKDGYLYLAPPQGDQNFLVQTAFIQPENIAPIENLKTKADIPKALEAMEKQDNQKGFKELAQQFGVIPDDQGKITFPKVYVPILPAFSSYQRMLTLEDFNCERFFEQFDSRSKDHLRAALEICEVVGSLVRKYEITGGKVYLETIPESLQGEGEKYPSKALKGKVEATDSKAHLARNANRLYFGTRYGFSIIDIPNKQSSTSGEIVTLIIKIKENILKERIKILFEGKLNRVLEKIKDKFPEANEEEIKALFFQLDLKDIFLSKATELVPLLIEKLLDAKNSR